jgi:subtilisin-like proprotein convertase family protein
VLHDQEEGRADNIHRVFDARSPPSLTELIGRSPEGIWALEVEDRAAQDEGEIISFGLELGL